MSIAVVGNAEYLFHRSYGAEIESHSLVARMNRAAMLFTTFDAHSTHGSKTDMWFMWRHQEYESVNIKKPPFAMQMASWEPLDDPSVQLYPIERAQWLEATLGSTPSTGLMTLDFLDVATTDHISVYGFDWKATPTFTDPKRETDKMIGIHDFNAERSYCEQRFMNNPRFTFRY